MKMDGRSLNHEALEHIRKVAVARVKAGERPGAISTSYGFARTTIYKWLRAEAQGGEEALRARKATGRPRKLTVRQMDREHHLHGPAAGQARHHTAEAAAARLRARPGSDKEVGAGGLPRPSDAPPGRTWMPRGQTPHRAHQRPAPIHQRHPGGRRSSIAPSGIPRLQAVYAGGNVSPHRSRSVAGVSTRSLY